MKILLLVFISLVFFGCADKSSSAVQGRVVCLEYYRMILGTPKAFYVDINDHTEKQLSDCDEVFTENGQPVKK